MNSPSHPRPQARPHVHSRPHPHCRSRPHPRARPRLHALAVILTLTLCLTLTGIESLPDENRNPFIPRYLLNYYAKGVVLNEHLVNKFS